MSDSGFTLDTAGQRVDDGWDHDGDLIASLQADLNRQLTAALALIDDLMEYQDGTIQQTGWTSGVRWRGDAWAELQRRRDELAGGES